MHDFILNGLNKAIKNLKDGKSRFETSTLTGDQIKAIRKRSGMSQVAFAEHLGISVDTLKSWEIGRRRPGRITSRILDTMKAELEDA
ncbi:helix-turn-helix domain-containing protein [Mesorhizobium sp. M0589]|uniref:helix-turn-helix domain-containing protein n=1 Tax=Mesorhizobium sp. M0589 TaxID=2956965 RepID=UPI00333AFD37